MRTSFWSYLSFVWLVVCGSVSCLCTFCAVVFIPFLYFVHMFVNVYIVFCAACWHSEGFSDSCCFRYIVNMQFLIM